MNRLFLLPSSVLGLVAFAAVVSRGTTAQDQFVFEGVGPGFRGIARGPNDKYYILTAPGPSVQIYDDSGKRVGQVPNEAAAAKKGVGLVYGESFDVDGQGRVAVSDRGANAVKIYGPDGSLGASIPVRGPAPVVLLPENEVAVGSPESEHIVTSYDLT